MSPEELAAELLAVTDRGRKEADAFIHAVNRITRDVPGRVVLHRVRTWQELHPKCVRCEAAFSEEPRLFLEGLALCDTCFFDPDLSAWLEEHYGASGDTEAEEALWAQAALDPEFTGEDVEARRLTRLADLMSSPRPEEL